MKNDSRRIALCSMMCALATVGMLLGGMIPMATFCCPAFAGLMLVPLVVEFGRRAALGAYVAVACLSLILCPDKEAALLFAFVGYYPAIKGRLDGISRKWLRRLAKFAILNAAIAAMYALIFYVLKLDQVMADFQDATRVTVALLVILGNITLALYDRLLTVGAYLYVHRLRPRLFGHHDH